MSLNNERRVVVDEREALSAYFQALLVEESIETQPISEVVVAEPEPEREPVVESVEVPESIEVTELVDEVVLSPPLLEEIPPPVFKSKIFPEEVPLAFENEVVSEEIQPPLQSEVIVEAAPQREPVPEWGKEKFQVMLFNVAGLALAVPLVELNGVQEWQEDEVTPMPGHALWYMGLINYRDQQVPVIDTARFVLPADRQDMLTEDINERLHRIVYIGDGSWGLACDDVAEVITIEPEQVRWRSNRTTRRWLAGTVIEQMCALIDPPVFAEMLEMGMDIEDFGL